MATRGKSALFKRKGYHHGNLKEALVAAARALIAERGPAGFTLAEAARRAGVSAAAPYRHFKDREALIAEVAERGFADLGARLGAAWSGIDDDPQQGFARMGSAYLAFAREEPGFYGAMFARGGGPRSSQQRKAGGPAFAALENAIARTVAASGMPAQAGARVLAYHVWAFSHGVAMLAAGGLLPVDETFSPEWLLQEGVGALLLGSTQRSPASAAEAGAAPAPGVPATRRRKNS